MAAPNESEITQSPSPEPSAQTESNQPTDAAPVVIKHHSRIKRKPQNYKELISLERADIATLWKDEALCLKYMNWMERAISSSNSPRPFLQYMGFYVEECLFELDAMDTPSMNPDNYGAAGQQPPMSAAASNLIYEVIPRLTESLAVNKPSRASAFAMHHFFRCILRLCRRCIELDIECFRLLEIIFGFVRKDVHKMGYYDVCGLPRPSRSIRGGASYRRGDNEWTPTQYGNGEIALYVLPQNGHSKCP